LGNIIEGKYKDEGGRMKACIERRRNDESGSVGTSFGLFKVKCAHKHINGDKVHLLARPLPAEREPNIISGIVTDVIFQQDRFKVTFDNGLYVYLDEAPKTGQKISVKVKVECLA
jgi:hypothetical protein